MIYKGFVSENPQIEVGMLVEILDVDPVYSSRYPPIGSIVPVVESAADRIALDCTEWGLSKRTGYGLTYKISTRKRKVRGVAQFLKERNL